MVKSFFNPTWKDLGVLASYGRWIGVNWVWAEWLTIFHAIFSITIPIFLVELTYPQTRFRVWLSSRSRVFFHALLLLSIILGFFAFPYDAPVLALASCVIGVVILGLVAKHTPNIIPKQRSLRVSWKVLVPLGVSVPAVFFFLFTSALIPSAIATMVLGGLLVFGYERLLRRWAKMGFSDLQRLGLMTGALGFWALFFDPILEILGRMGTSLLGLGFIVYLLILRRKSIQGFEKSPHLQLGVELPKATEPVAR